MNGVKKNENKAKYLPGDGRLPQPETQPCGAGCCSNIKRHARNMLAINSMAF